MSKHHCKAAVVTCIDFRFQEKTNQCMAVHGLTGDNDRISVAGSSKDRELVFGQIKISKKLHDIGKVYLIHHEDCGAYGLPQEMSVEKQMNVHLADMREMKELIRKEFGEVLIVHLFFERLDGQIIEIE